jgi:hypothetical protein
MCRTSPTCELPRAWSACLSQSYDCLPSNQDLVVCPLIMNLSEYLSWLFLDTLWLHHPLPLPLIGWSTPELPSTPDTTPTIASPTDWVVDSRATFHTTPTISSLFHFHPPHPSHPPSHPSHPLARYFTCNEILHVCCFWFAQLHQKAGGICLNHKRAGGRSGPEAGRSVVRTVRACGPDGPRMRRTD